MNDIDWGAAAIFWFLAIAPGLLHPAVLYIYFQRFRARKNVLLSLIDRKHGATHLTSTRDQMVEWRTRLNLDWWSYALPVAMCSLLATAAGIAVVARHDAANIMHLSPGLKAMIASASDPVVAGFAGAFVWGMYDFVDRFRILNLSPGALHMTWFRLLLGPVLGHYIQFASNEKVGPFLAFALATVPVPDLAAWVRDKARSSLSISAAQTAAPRWELLQGLTPDMVPRMVEAGVSSVAHLANQDPISLLRRTNVEWRNVLDMMDQAYLCEYVDAGLPKLRARGIRGAIEMAILHGRLQSTDVNIRTEAASVVAGVATDLAVDESSVRNLARNLFEDPQVDLIWTLWYERDGPQGQAGTSEPPQRGEAKTTAA